MTGRILAATVSFLWLPCMLRAQVIHTMSPPDQRHRVTRHNVVGAIKAGDSVQAKVARWEGRSLTGRAAKAGRDREILPP